MQLLQTDYSTEELFYKYQEHTTDQYWINYKEAIAIHLKI